jgi:acyl-CoA reductase-like NAD-dependent aldehyde dehydrogenase
MTVELSVPVVHLHIGGEARATGSGGVHQHVYPATGEIQGTVPLAGPDDVDEAVQAAQAALPASGRPVACAAPAL